MLKRSRSKARIRIRKTGSTAAADMISAAFTSAARMTLGAMTLATPTATPVKGKAPAGKGSPKPAKRPPAAKPHPRTAMPPRKASFRTDTHSCAFGTRRYKIYTPASAATSADPMPLLIMLHGCGQTPDDFAKGTRMNMLAEEFRLLVVYPAQTREAHPRRCWNWFRRGDQLRDAGEPGLIASLTRHVIRTHLVDPSRVYVAGLSAGASLALILADAYPDMFAAVGAHSGLPVGAARDQTSALMAMGQGNPGNRRIATVPTIVFQGGEDRVVNPRNGRFIALRASEPYPRLRTTELRREVPRGHSYVKTIHRLGQGRPLIEHWLINGSGHAWSGGSSAGRFVDPAGPDASREMVRFFLRHTLSARKRSAVPAF